MTELGVVRRTIKRANRTSADALGAFGAATVHEAMGRVGLMNPYMAVRKDQRLARLVRRAEQAALSRTGGRIQHIREA